jgi:hypothetical protein
VALSVADLSGLPEDRQMQEARRLITDVPSRPFDLTRGPLLRCALLKLGDDDHVMAYAVHRIVADIWSVRLLTREVALGYLARSSGRLPALPELPIQHRDFAAWQQGKLSGAALQERVAWWRNRLAGAPAFLRLPTDRPRPPVQSPRAAQEIRELPAELVEPLRTLSATGGGGLFPVFLTAFQILLGTRAGQQDFVIASPVGFRDRPEIENLIGPFVKTLLLRSDLTGDPPLRSLLARSRNQISEAYTHSDVPLNHLLEELATDRTQGIAPFLQVGLNFMDFPPPEALEASELSARPLDIEAEFSPFELYLVLVHTGSSFRASLRYRVGLFTRDTAAAMANDFAVILHWLGSRPEEALSDLQEALEQEECRVALASSTPSVVDWPGSLRS